MLNLQPVAHIRSPYQQKLGVPRQSGLASGVRARVVFDESWIGGESVRGLDEVSHLWLVWGFSEHFGATKRDTVRPPRLGGQQRLGVFATRSSFRPNPLGLSLVRLHQVDFPTLHVEGADLLDGTPLYDIKPYLAWAESVPEAQCPWAPAPPVSLLVEFAPELERTLQLMPEQARVDIEQSLAFDPRPAWQRAGARSWGTCIAGYDLRFTVADGRVRVDALKPVG